jgi:hypothetical protein
MTTFIFNGAQCLAQFVGQALSKQVVGQSVLHLAYQLTPPCHYKQNINREYFFQFEAKMKRKDCWEAKKIEAKQTKK